VSLNGVTHLPRQVKYDMKELQDEEEHQELIFDRIGHPTLDKEMLEANSPALNANKIRIPVMIVAGTDDDIVPYAQARLMVKALKKANVEHEFVSLKDTGHNPFYYREDIETVFKAVEKFLALHLR
jgi:dipeptidyl aminopeptidase/acylaminoacyl peptidase